MVRLVDAQVLACRRRAMRRAVVATALIVGASACGSDSESVEAAGGHLASPSPPSAELEGLVWSDLLAEADPCYPTPPETLSEIFQAPSVSVSPELQRAGFELDAYWWLSLVPNDLAASESADDAKLDLANATFIAGGPGVAPGSADMGQTMFESLRNLVDASVIPVTVWIGVQDPMGAGTVVVHSVVLVTEAGDAGWVGCDTRSVLTDPLMAYAESHGLTPRDALAGLVSRDDPTAWSEFDRGFWGHQAGDSATPWEERPSGERQVIGSDVPPQVAEQVRSIPIQEVVLPAALRSESYALCVELVGFAWGSCAETTAEYLSMPIEFRDNTTTRLWLKPLDELGGLTLDGASGILLGDVHEDDVQVLATVIIEAEGDLTTLAAATGPVASVSIVAGASSASENGISS